METKAPIYAPGLAGIAAAKTRKSRIDGERGELLVCGYRVEDFAERANFEEIIFLLLHDRRAAPEELAAFIRELTALREAPPEVLALIQAAVRQGAPIIDALRMGSAALSLGQTSSDPFVEARRVIAAYPTLVACASRAARGLAAISPRADLDHAANFLYMLHGDAPSAAHVRALHTYWNTVADHGLNPSTFAARVIASTRSDMISALTGALGALKGPLHGGAPGPALDLVFEIGQAERAEEVIHARLMRGERLMGFGHRLYRVRDPRAEVLARAAEQLYADDAELNALYRLALAVEQTALRLLQAHKPERVLQTNVEFYTALVLHGLGLPSEMFTPVFACGRAAGWAAHALEQRLQRFERSLRPDAIYEGATDLKWAE